MSIDNEELLLKQLILKVGTLCQPSFYQLYDRTYQRLFCFAERLLNDVQDAEEVVNDTFMQVWKSARLYDETKSSVLSWMYMICKSRVLDKIKRNRRSSKLADAIGKDDEVHNDRFSSASIHENYIHLLQMRTYLSRWIEKLSVQQQNLVELVYFKEMSQNETSWRLNIPLGTVKTVLRCALRELKKNLNCPL